MANAQSIIDYYRTLPEAQHFVHIAETSDAGCDCYRMMPDYGSGSIRILTLHDQILIVQADFTPLHTFEKVSNIAQEYLEISQFETASSAYQISGHRLRHVERGICCYVNTQRTAYAFCDAGQPTRFTKVIVSRSYFDQFLQHWNGDSYDNARRALNNLSDNPNAPELNFLFQQIKDCPAKRQARNLYLEGKVMELLSLLTHAAAQQSRPLPVKLDRRDKRALAKAVAHMKRDLAAYPSIAELAQTANMSPSRFQMAFRQVYGTTAYNYLKTLRMNAALLLLQDSDDNIRDVARKVGYRNAGHFARLFRETFGLAPQAYRNIHHIK